MLLREHSSMAGRGFRPAPAGQTTPCIGLTQITVAQLYGLPLEALLASTRGDPRAARARQVAMYLAHVVFRLSMATVARGFGRHRTTATHACRRVEVLREDAAYDAQVASMEQFLREATRVQHLPGGRP